jgi:hypothetical protein
VASSGRSPVERRDDEHRRQHLAGDAEAARLSEHHQPRAGWMFDVNHQREAADAQALLLRHALRSGDAVQLASSLYLQRKIGERVLFAAFDDRLNNAARAEGLALIDLS